MVNKDMALEFTKTYFSGVLGVCLKRNSYFWTKNIQGNDMLTVKTCKKREYEEECYIHFNKDSVIFESPDHGIKLDFTDVWETFKQNYEENANAGV